MVRKIIIWFFRKLDVRLIVNNGTGAGLTVHFEDEKILDIKLGDCNDG